MPLMKVEELTNILIDREYINRPRSHRCRAVFRERLELLVMSALYLLGTGAACHSCKPLCGISTSEVWYVSAYLFIFSKEITAFRCILHFDISPLNSSRRHFLPILTNVHEETRQIFFGGGKGGQGPQFWSTINFN